METPATPPPQVSGDEETNMEEEEENRYLGPRDDPDDGAQAS